MTTEEGAAHTEIQDDGVVENPPAAEPELAYQGDVEAKAKPEGVKRRLGTTTIILLVGGLLAEIIVVAIISWLWFSDPANETWRRTVTRGWTTRVITLTSIAFRTAVTTQCGLCIAMLAAVVLESQSVAIKEFADVSLIRTGNGTGPLSVISNFLWPVFCGSSPVDRRAYPLLLALALTITGILAQFVSTILLGDLAIYAIPGDLAYRSAGNDFPFTRKSFLENNHRILDTMMRNKNLNRLMNADNVTIYGYDYAPPTTSYWVAKRPAIWPTFAEYAEAPYRTKGVSDTGVCLRALLPFGDSKNRENIMEFKGRAMVLDSRVTCQRPNVTGVTSIPAKISGGWGTVSGTVAPTVHTPRMNTKRIGRRTFNCSYPPPRVFSTDPSSYSICELPPAQDDPLGRYSASLKENSLVDVQSGGLTSMFRLPNASSNGAAFVIFRQGPDGVDSSFAKLGVNPYEQPVWGTLCYASLDVANRVIEAYSNTNRSEPTEITSYYGSNSQRSDPVYSQMNSNLPKGNTTEERGILHLKARSDWTESAPNQTDIDGPDQLPYVGNLTVTKLTDVGLMPKRDNNNTGISAANSTYPSGGVTLKPLLVNAMHIHTDQSGSSQLDPSAGNYYDNSTWSVVVTREAVGWNDFAQKNPTTLKAPEWMISLSEVFEYNPSLALQSILTTIAGLAYYDADYLQKYTAKSDTEQIFFSNALAPRSGVGKRKTVSGYAFLMSLLLFHLLLVVGALLAFTKHTRRSRIRDVWQAVGQVGMNPECVALMEAANVSEGDGSRTTTKVLYSYDEVHIRVVAAEAGNEGGPLLSHPDGSNDSN